VEGRPFSTVIKLSPPTAPLPDAIRQIDGVRELTTFEIVADVIMAQRSRRSFATPTVHRVRAGQTCQRHSDAGRFGTGRGGLAGAGGCDLVVIVRGDSFQAIDRM